jgi:hypothetical protein
LSRDEPPPSFGSKLKQLARFWRRRCFHAFTPANAPNGESDYAINVEQLTFALSKVAYYQDLLDKRTLEVKP